MRMAAFLSSCRHQKLRLVCEIREPVHHGCCDWLLEEAIWLRPLSVPVISLLARFHCGFQTSREVEISTIFWRLCTAESRIFLAISWSRKPVYIWKPWNATCAVAKQHSRLDLLQQLISGKAFESRSPISGSKQTNRGPFFQQQVILPHHCSLFSSKWSTQKRSALPQLLSQRINALCGFGRGAIFNVPL
mmetsp:Transcript_20571/g.52274  ORF Transcript_20571/g.52274 Transcript_20571/m.52274 type:complete len:190 (+) Transcript_20571:852-1421(+)